VVVVTASVVVVSAGAVVVVVVVVVVSAGAVVVVVSTGAVVVVVSTGAVVVVAPGGQGFGEQLPGPASCPPWALHSAGVRSIQVSKAPVADDCTQHWVCAGVVVVVAPPVVVVVAAPVVVVAAGVVVVVVVLPGAPHASQQLGVEPTNADPPLGALQAAAVRLIEQVVLPVASVRQQATAPSKPQVDCAAQDTTVSWHSSRSSPSATASSATMATQFTYLP